MFTTLRFGRLRARLALGALAALCLLTVTYPFTSFGACEEELNFVRAVRRGDATP